MNKFFILFKKEIRDLVTAATVIPMIIVFVMFYFLGDIINVVSGGQNGQNTEAVYIEPPEAAGNYGVIYSQKSIVGFIDNDNSRLSQYIKDRLMYLDHNPDNGIIPVVPQSRDPDEAMKELGEFIYTGDLYEWDDKTQSAAVTPEGVNWTTQSLIVIPEGFEASLLAGFYTPVDVYSAVDSFGLAAIVSGTSGNNAVAAINGLLSRELLGIYESELGAEIDIDYINFINYPVYPNNYTFLNGRTENINSAMIMGYVSTQTMILPIAIFFVLMISTQMLAGSIVNEKTDKTLETLMTAPLHRMSVLLAKIFSAALYAVVYAAVYIIAYNRFMDSISGGASYPDGFFEILEKFGITFGATAFAIIGTQLFLSVLCGLAVSMLIGMMIDDIKTLQAYLMPLMYIIMIPYFLSVFIDINTLPAVLRAVVYIIPFTHTFVAATNLFMQNYALIAFGIIYQAVSVAALLTVAVKIFNSDKLFTLGQLLKKKPGKRKIKTKKKTPKLI